MSKLLKKINLEQIIGLNIAIEIKSEFEFKNLIKEFNKLYPNEIDTDKYINDSYRHIERQNYDINGYAPVYVIFKKHLWKITKESQLHRSYKKLNYEDLYEVSESDEIIKRLDKIIELLNK